MQQYFYSPADTQRDRSRSLHSGETNTLPPPSPDFDDGNTYTCVDTTQLPAATNAQPQQHRLLHLNYDRQERHAIRIRHGGEEGVAVESKRSEKSPSPRVNNDQNHHQHANAFQEPSPSLYARRPAQQQKTSNGKKGNEEQVSSAFLQRPPDAVASVPEGESASTSPAVSEASDVEEEDEEEQEEGVYADDDADDFDADENVVGNDDVRPSGVSSSIYSKNHTNNKKPSNMNGGQGRSGGSSITAEVASSGYKLGTSERNRLEALLKAKKQMERRRREELKLQQECTFRPRVNANSTTVARSGSAAPSSPTAALDDQQQFIVNNSPTTTTTTATTLPVEERLLNFEKQRKARLQRELLAKIEADRQQFSFQPSIDARSLRTARKLHPATIAVEDRLIHYKTSVEESRRLLKERMLAEEEEMRRLATPMTTHAYYTAHPHKQANANTNIASRRRGGSWHNRAADNATVAAAEKPFLVRMREAEMQKQASLAVLKDKELAECTFKPSISKLSKLFVEEKQRQKDEEAAAAEVDEYQTGDDAEANGAIADAADALNQSGAFRLKSSQQHHDPATTATTTTTARRRNNSSRRIEELYREAQQRQALLDQKRFARQVQETAVCGKPFISAGTDKIVKEGGMKDVYSCDFVQRQAIFQQLATDHAKVLKAIAVNAETGGVRRGKSKQKRRHALDGLDSSDFDSDDYDGCSGSDDEERPLTVEEMEEQVNRLYHKSTAVSQQLRKILETERLKEQCTFKPRLSPATVLYLKQKEEEGGGQKNVVERLTQQRPPQQQQAQAQKTEKQSGSAVVGVGGKEAPSRASSVDRGTANHSRSQTPTRRKVSEKDADEFYQRQIATLRKKQERIAQQKALKMLEAQKDCTFQPDIHVSSPSGGGLNSSVASRSNTPFRRSASAPQSLNTSSVAGMGGGERSSARAASRGRSGSVSSAYDPSTTAARLVQTITGASTFLKRQALARQQRQEKDELMQNVGRGKPCNGPSYTIVRPFLLSSGRGQSREMANHFDPTSQFEQPLMTTANANIAATDTTQMFTVQDDLSVKTNSAAARSFGQPLNPNVSIAYPFMKKGTASRQQYLQPTAAAPHTAAELNRSSRRRDPDDVMAIVDDTTAAVNMLLKATTRYDSGGAENGDHHTYTIDLGGSPVNTNQNSQLESHAAGKRLQNAFAKHNTSF